ncbi:hypothetical protein BACPEC_00638 [[Bacteroides] pectinophilus ATCC 43243]|uniref:Uncharacterized protein n=1 Tax=[Bacteroides] pectinophilus ATCC 43243 TaxID=483218 RepID=B7APN2_9FIRM|nr:hypothetical protein BACPEC_00638 [[Bacteroides] pectinophilus ATCC 43243]
MGLHGRQLHIHDLCDLGVGLVRTEQMENLQLRGRQLLTGGKAGFEEMRVERRLRPHRRHQPLAPCFVAVPVQRFQQRQHRRAVYADGADEAVLRRRVQRRRQSLAPPLILLAAQGDGSQDIQVDAVDDAGAVLNVRLQRGKRQLRRVRSTVLQLHHCLREILVAPHDVQVREFARGFFPIPRVCRIKVAGVHVNTAEHGVHIGQKACQTALGKAFTEYLDGAPRVGGLPVCKLAASQQSTDGELHVRRAVVAHLVHLREKGQHPPCDVLALFKLTFGNGAVRKAHAVPPQYSLHRETEGLVEQVVLFAPFGKVLAAIHDARQRARDGKGRQRHLFVRQQTEHGGDGLRQTVHAPLWQGDVQPCKAAARLLSGGILPAAVFGKLLQFAIPALRAFVIHGQCAEHTHALHQRGGGENFRLRQAAVVFFHLGIVTHAGVEFCITHQQLRNLGIVTAAGVAFQGMGVVLLQLIVQPAPG